MRRTMPPCGVWVVLAAATAAATAGAQVPATTPAGTAPQPAAPQQTAGPALGTHRIDRYEAIRQVREALTKDANNLNDWIILGELAQEVAADVPSEQAAGYYRLASDAYDSALKLKPGDPNLKAAAQFAREQERAAEGFAQTRRQAAVNYLAARRRELAAPGGAPRLRVYSAPGANAAASYSYQPYTTAAGQPYTYQEYSRGYEAPDTPAGVSAQPSHPITDAERGALVKPGAAAAPP
ncbi:hypothetical protein OJF2_41650 [Aquisphaera giovannonii]|uniref:Tetratricopeptide repeat protein n=1 Tax=Aquisphaera giovannonii TaxID=406548 RepID=A0A5B9W4V3_9BACT|nr:hypothetical protein [Aquisphaera giovannonii]QEH35612.1 hypothetical protein OJF2_41650 [Aquisphaera giovannonii]